MRESEYQGQIIARLSVLFPGCVVLKNDTGYLQGVPDLLVLYRNYWAMLEVKPKRHAIEQPNQRYYVELFDGMSFGSFIYPENEEEVLYDLQCAFGIARPTRISKRK